MPDTPDLQAFEALSPMVKRLRAMQRQTKPFSADYHAIAISLAALDECAQHFTGRRSFYGASGDAAGEVKRWEPRGE